MDTGSAFIIGLTTGVLGSFGVFLYFITRNQKSGSKDKPKESEDEQVKGRILFLNVIILDGKRDIVERELLLKSCKLPSVQDQSEISL